MDNEIDVILVPYTLANLKSKTDCYKQIVNRVKHLHRNLNEELVHEVARRYLRCKFNENPAELMKVVTKVDKSLYKGKTQKMSKIRIRPSEICYKDLRRLTNVESYIKSSAACNTELSKGHFELAIKKYFEEVFSVADQWPNEIHFLDSKIQTIEDLKATKKLNESNQTSLEDSQEESDQTNTEIRPTDANSEYKAAEGISEENANQMSAPVMSTYNKSNTKKDVAVPAANKPSNKPSKSSEKPSKGLHIATSLNSDEVKSIESVQINDHANKERPNPILCSNSTNASNHIEILPNQLGYEDLRALTNVESVIKCDILKRFPRTHDRYLSQIEKYIKRYYDTDFINKIRWPPTIKFHDSSIRTLSDLHRVKMQLQISSTENQIIDVKSNDFAETNPKAVQEKAPIGKQSTINLSPDLFPSSGEGSTPPSKEKDDQSIVETTTEPNVDNKRHSQILATEKNTPRKNEKITILRNKILKSPIEKGNQPRELETVHSKNASNMNNVSSAIAKSINDENNPQNSQTLAITSSQSQNPDDFTFLDVANITGSIPFISCSHNDPLEMSPNDLGRMNVSQTSTADETVVTVVLSNPSNKEIHPARSDTPNSQDSIETDIFFSPFMLPGSKSRKENDHPIQLLVASSSPEISQTEENRSYKQDSFITGTPITNVRPIPIKDEPHEESDTSAEFFTCKELNVLQNLSEYFKAKALSNNQVLNPKHRTEMKSRIDSDLKRLSAIIGQSDLQINVAGYEITQPSKVSPSEISTRDVNTITHAMPSLDTISGILTPSNCNVENIADLETGDSIVSPTFGNRISDEIGLQIKKEMIDRSAFSDYSSDVEIVDVNESIVTVVDSEETHMNLVERMMNLTDSSLMEKSRLQNTHDSGSIDLNVGDNLKTLECIEVRRSDENNRLSQVKTKPPGDTNRKDINESEFACLIGTTRNSNSEISAQNTSVTKATSVSFTATDREKSPSSATKTIPNVRQYKSQRIRKVSSKKLEMNQSCKPVTSEQSCSLTGTIKKDSNIIVSADPSETNNSTSALKQPDHNPVDNNGPQTNTIRTPITKNITSQSDLRGQLNLISGIPSNSSQTISVVNSTDTRISHSNDASHKCEQQRNHQHVEHSTLKFERIENNLISEEEKQSQILDTVIKTEPVEIEDRLTDKELDILRELGQILRSKSISVEKGSDIFSPSGTVVVDTNQIDKIIKPCRATGETKIKNMKHAIKVRNSCHMEIHKTQQGLTLNPNHHNMIMSSNVLVDVGDRNRTNSDQVCILPSDKYQNMQQVNVKELKNCTKQVRIARIAKNDNVHLNHLPIDGERPKEMNFNENIKIAKTQNIESKPLNIITKRKIVDAALSTDMTKFLPLKKRKIEKLITAVTKPSTTKSQSKPATGKSKKSSIETNETLAPQITHNFRPLELVSASKHAKRSSSEIPLCNEQVPTKIRRKQIIDKNVDPDVFIEDASETDVLAALEEKHSSVSHALSDGDETYFREIVTDRLSLSSSCLHSTLNENNDIQFLESSSLENDSHSPTHIIRPVAPTLFCWITNLNLSSKCNLLIDISYCSSFPFLNYPPNEYIESRVLLRRREFLRFEISSNNLVLRVELDAENVNFLSSLLSNINMNLFSPLQMITIQMLRQVFNQFSKYSLIHIREEKVYPDYVMNLSVETIPKAKSITLHSNNFLKRVFGLFDITRSDERNIVPIM